MIYIYIYIIAYIYIYIYMYIYICVCDCVHICIHTYDTGPAQVKSNYTISKRGYRILGPIAALHSLPWDPFFLLMWQALQAIFLVVKCCGWGLQNYLHIFVCCILLHLITPDTVVPVKTELLVWHGEVWAF